MEPAAVTAIVSAGIAVLAVTLSFVAMWRTHFAPFRPVCTVGALGLRVYPIRSGDERWFIPSADVAVSIANDGARPGRVRGLRLAVTYPHLPVAGCREVFEPRWEVEAGRFRRIGRERFQWLDEATLGLWMPFVVLPKSTVTKHIVFESRWDTPFVPGLACFAAEILTDSCSQWTEIGRWELPLTEDSWTTLFMTGRSLLTDTTDSSHMHEGPSPPDLHKYAGRKDLISEKWVEREPSYLDYTPSDLDYPTEG